MIRLIVTTSDFGAAAHIGGIVHTSSKTFDVDNPALEKELTVGNGEFVSVALSYEVLPANQGGAQ